MEFGVISVSEAWTRHLFSSLYALPYEGEVARSADT